MPFYTRLKAQPDDSAGETAKKQRVAARLLALRTALTQHLSASGSTLDRGRSVRIGTWNLREFGGSKYGGRDYECLYYLAEVISQFDIVALQEIRANLGEFLELKKILGPDWDYLATDVADGDAGNGERMVYLFNRRQVQFCHIAGELTLKEGGKVRAAFGERVRLDQGLTLRLPAGAPGLSGTYPARLRSAGSQKKLDADLEIPLPAGSALVLPDGASLVVAKNTAVQSPGTGRATVQIGDPVGGTEYRLRFPDESFDDSLRQFARTPYLIAFQAGWLKLNLCTVHIYYGDDDDSGGKMEQRRSEIEKLTQALAGKAKDELKADKEAFLGVLGDFNIIGAGHPTMAALESNGFVIPEKLKSIPGSNVAKDKAYDQIAFWNPARTEGYARLDVLGAGVFDFYEHVYRLEDEPIYRAEGAENGLKPNSK